jgi:L-threonylcarbamoyladenylate synthase
VSPETRLVSALDDDWLTQATEVLLQGGLVAFPTDTVYGLGALPTDVQAVESIFRAKARARDKFIPVLVAGWAEAARLAAPVPPAERLARAFWPGALTLILRKTSSLSGSMWSDGTVGVRAPDHEVALKLLRAAGPLATSSANRSGEESLREAASVLDRLAGRIDLIVDGGVTPGGRPSTVIDCTGDAPVLVRDGPITLDAIRTAWG